MICNYKNGYNIIYFYSRITDESQETIDKNASALQEYLESNPICLSSRVNEVSVCVEKNCLGKTPTLERDMYSKLLIALKLDNTKKLLVRDLCDISTDPQELVENLFYLTEKGITIYVMDGTVITSQTLKNFDYSGVLAQVENLIANDADGRFKLIGDHPERKVWYDTLEEVLYCKSWFDDGSVGFYPIDYSLYYETEKWHTKEGIDELALDQLYQIIYESHFVEEVTYNGVDYYVWFEANVLAHYSQCGVGLNKSIIETYDNIIAAKEKIEKEKIKYIFGKDI